MDRQPRMRNEEWGKYVNKQKTAYFSSRASAVWGFTLRYLHVGLP